MYEELYFNITSNSTGVAYNLTRPPIPWNYTQCAIADSQFFWAGTTSALDDNTVLHCPCVHFMFNAGLHLQLLICERAGQKNPVTISKTSSALHSIPQLAY